jgi:two-component system, chemotaxis family, protein-glutamate methylesterase/glutaminase
VTTTEAVPAPGFGSAPGGRTLAPYRLMVVDDSAAIRGLLIRALETDPEVAVIASASNGKAALAVLERNDIEVVILDIEMPVMDGLTALPKLLAAKPDIKVIIASTLTRRGADISIRALAAGAADYLTKPGSLALSSADQFKRDLLAKVKVLGQLKGALRQPIFITQHMPATFTTILAEHIARASGCPTREAIDGEPVLPGRIYVAPGDFHMTIETVTPGHRILRLSKEPPENFCRPSVDPMLRSLTQSYGSRVLTVMLTGMGRDGLAGSRALAQAGGTIIAQDEPTSIVWGMPGAVAMAGVCSAVLPLAEIAPLVEKLASRGAR